MAGRMVFLAQRTRTRIHSIAAGGSDDDDADGDDDGDGGSGGGYGGAGVHIESGMRTPCESERRKLLRAYYMTDLIGLG